MNNYERMFQYVTSPVDRTNNIEKGYKLLILLVNSFGGNNFILRLVVSIVSYYFIYKLIRKYTDSSLLILINYSLYNFYYDLTQVRFFIGFIIFLFSLEYLTNRKIKTYFLLNILGLSFHRSLAFVLILPILVKVKKKQQLILVITLSVIGVILIKCLSFETFLLNQRYAKYFNKNMNFGFLIPIFLISYNIFFIKTTKNWDIKFTKNSDYKNLIEIYTLFLFLLTPFYFINYETTRLLRNSFILFDIYWIIKRNELLENSILKKTIIYLIIYSKYIFILIVEIPKETFLPIQVGLSNSVLDFFK